MKLLTTVIAAAFVAAWAGAAVAECGHDAQPQTSAETVLPTPQAPSTGS